MGGASGYGVRASGYGVRASGYGVGASGYGSLVILESAQGPNPFFSFFGGLLFDLGAYWDQDLDQGLTISSCCQMNFNLNLFSDDSESLLLMNESLYISKFLN